MESRHKSKAVENSGDSMPFIDKLLGYFESEAAIIDEQFMSDPRDIPGYEGFRSCIRFNGEPILPPLMTEERRTEMQMYKHQAIMAETRMRARARQKLLERVQIVMNSIDQKHGTKQHDDDDYSVTSNNESAPDKDELKLALNSLTGNDKIDVDTDTNVSSSPERQTDEANKHNTTQSPRTDSGICSRAATSADMTDVPDENQTTQEPFLDTMAEITDISSGSDTEDEKHEKPQKTSPKIAAKEVIQEKSNGTNESELERKNNVLSEPKVAFKMTESMKPKEGNQEILRASAKSTSSSTTTVSSNEMNKTVISKEDTASYQSLDGIDPLAETPSQLALEILPEIDAESPRVNSETQTDKAKASDFEEVETTNKTKSETLKIGELTIEEGTLLSKVDIGAFSDSMDLSSDDENVQDTNNDSVCDDNKNEIIDSDKARPTSVQSMKSPKMLKDVQDIKCMPSPTPSSTPDVSRISVLEEGSVGHNESMRSEILRTSIDFEQEDEQQKHKAVLKSDDTYEPPKCSTRLAHAPTVDVETESAAKSGECAVSPEQLSHTSVAETTSRSSDTLTTQTCSTDLGRYMAQSVDTLISSDTTLPHIHDIPDLETVPGVEDLTPVPEQDEDLASTQRSTLPDANNKDFTDEELHHMIEGLRPVRRGSYTLSQPSPALVKSQCTADEIRSQESPVLQPDSDNDNEVTTVKRNGNGEKDTKKAHPVEVKNGSAPSPESRSFQLTSSMEDLKMKVVQRKLEFNEEQQVQENVPVHIPGEMGVTKDPSEKQGKEEHLARYLENLSQLPGMKPYKRKIKHTNEESNQFVTSKEQFSPVTFTPQDTLELESTNSQRLSAKFTEQLLSQMQAQDFEVDSLASMSYCQDLENVGTAHTSAVNTSRQSVEEEFLGTQLEYFETCRQQLITQQQDQLRSLMVEQQKQQMLFQQEILRQGQSLLQSIQTGTLPIQTRQSLPTDMHTGSVYPSQSLSGVTTQSEAQTLPLEVLQQYQQQLSSPFVLNTGALPHISAEEQLLAQFFNASYQPSMISQDFEQSYEPAKTSRKKQPKGKSHLNQSQKVSFSIDSNQPMSKHSGRSKVAYESQDTANGLDSSLNQSEGELDISVVAGVQVPQFPGDVSHTSPRHYPNGTPTATAQSTPKSALKKSSKSLQSPGSSPTAADYVNDYGISPDLQRKFDKVSAAAKGYLTRRLMKTDKVQHVIQTIKDTAEFALHFQQETPIKKGQFTTQDRYLLERVLSQLTAAMYEIYEIFFELSIPERMYIIAQSRQQEREKMFKQQAQERKDVRVSAATQKAIERRKQAKAAEASVFGDMRPKSAPAHISSPRCDKHSDLSGHIRRNYGHIMAKAMKPMQSQHGPVKPAKDSFNKAVAKEHSLMLRHTNVAKRNVINKSNSNKQITKPKKTIGSPVSKTSSAGTKPAMKRVIAPVRTKPTTPAWK